MLDATFCQRSAISKPSCSSEQSKQSRNLRIVTILYIGREFGDLVLERGSSFWGSYSLNESSWKEVMLAGYIQLVVHFAAEFQFSCWSEALDEILNCSWGKFQEKLHVPIFGWIFSTKLWSVLLRCSNLCANKLFDFWSFPLFFFILIFMNTSSESHYYVFRMEKGDKMGWSDMWHVVDIECSNSVVPYFWELSCFAAPPPSSVIDVTTL